VLSASAGEVTASPVQFLTGDIDRDNAISVFDYDLLSQFFDTMSTDLGWNAVNSRGHCPRKCDLDEDGVISVFDYNLLFRNFDKHGVIY